MIKILGRLLAAIVLLSMAAAGSDARAQSAPRSQARPTEGPERALQLVLPAGSDPAKTTAAQVIAKTTLRLVADNSEHFSPPEGVSLAVRSAELLFDGRPLYFQRERGTFSMEPGERALVLVAASGPEKLLSQLDALPQALAMRRSGTPQTLGDSFVFPWDQLSIPGIKATTAWRSTSGDRRMAVVVLCPGKACLDASVDDLVADVANYWPFGDFRPSGQGSTAARSDPTTPTARGAAGAELRDGNLPSPQPAASAKGTPRQTTDGSVIVVPAPRAPFRVLLLDGKGGSSQSDDLTVRAAPRCDEAAVLAVAPTRQTFRDGIASFDERPTGQCLVVERRGTPVACLPFNFAAAATFDAVTERESQLQLHRCPDPDVQVSVTIRLEDGFSADTAAPPRRAIDPRQVDQDYIGKLSIDGRSFAADPNHRNAAVARIRFSALSREGRMPPLKAVSSSAFFEVKSLEIVDRNALVVVITPTYVDVDALQFEPVDSNERPFMRCVPILEIPRKLALSGRPVERLRMTVDNERYTVGPQPGLRIRRYGDGEAPRLLFEDPLCKLSGDDDRSIPLFAFMGRPWRPVVTTAGQSLVVLATRSDTDVREWGLDEDEESKFWQRSLGVVAKLESVLGAKEATRFDRVALSVRTVNEELPGAMNRPLSEAGGRLFANDSAIRGFVQALEQSRGQPQAGRGRFDLGSGLPTALESVLGRRDAPGRFAGVNVVVIGPRLTQSKDACAFLDSATFLQRRPELAGARIFVIELYHSQVDKVGNAYETKRPGLSELVLCQSEKQNTARGALIGIGLATEKTRDAHFNAVFESAVSFFTTR